MKRFLATFIGSVAAFGLIVAALPASATVMGVSSGDLIKLKGDRTVYYFDKEWHRRPFPNQRVYESWYRDFSGVKELTAEEMADIRLGSPVVYRPGTRLIKIPSIPKVYAVEPGGVLRWIETEAVAKALYGDNWSKRVDDVSEAFFTNYKEGAPLTVPVWPTGTVLRRSYAAVYVTEGLTKRSIQPQSLPTLRIREADIIAVTDAQLVTYANVGFVSESDPNYTDTGQIAFVDTLSEPAVDFPAKVDPLAPGTTQDFSVMRITSGMPVILRAVRVTISGPLWNGTSANLRDLRFVDVNGTDLFGTQQLLETGASSATLDFSGAYTMMPNTTSIVTLRATSVAALPKDTKFTVTVDRSRVVFADGSNGNVISSFYPSTPFPAAILEVK